MIDTISRLFMAISIIVMYAISSIYIYKTYAVVGGEPLTIIAGIVASMALGLASLSILSMVLYGEIE